MPEIDNIKFAEDLWEKIKGFSPLTKDAYDKAFDEAYKNITSKSLVVVGKTDPFRDSRVFSFVAKLCAWNFPAKDIINRLESNLGITITPKDIVSFKRKQSSARAIKRYRRGLVGSAARQIFGAYPAEQARRLDQIYDELINNEEIDPAIRFKLMQDNTVLMSKVSKPLQKFLDAPDHEELPENVKKARILLTAIKILNDDTFIGTPEAKEFLEKVNSVTNKFYKNLKEVN